jgi:Fic family protein
MNLSTQLQQLDQLKHQLNQHRPLPTTVVKNLHDDLVLRWTYHSNAIEGNTLTLLETKVVLEGITVGGKALREHFEAINHREAILYVEDIIQQQEALSEWQVRNIHQLILKNIDQDNAGRYRNVNVIISGASHRPPDHTQLTELMARLINDYHQQANQQHPIERAAALHADFVGIHPFIDGNGRTSRLLMNLDLMKSGFPPCVIQVQDRLRYYDALDRWHCHHDKTPFIQLIAEAVERAFEPYWYALGRKESP